jgi:hypothetical protein
MATSRKKSHQRPGVSTAASARSRSVAKRGVNTSSEFKQAMSSLMSDLIEGKVPPPVGNAVCNAGGKLLKVVEMEFKYARGGLKGLPGRLALTS